MSTLFALESSMGRKQWMVTLAFILAVASPAIYAEQMLASSQAGDTFVLISHDDLSRWAEYAVATPIQEPQAQDRFGAGVSDIDGPKLVIQTPKDHEITSPLDLIIDFEAKGGAQIDLDSLTVKYKKFVWVDVTKRLLQNAKVTSNGIVARGATVTKGEHLFRVSLSDNLGRQSVQELKFVCLSR
jgi:hypothetical protein